MALCVANCGGVPGVQAARRQELEEQAGVQGGQPILGGPPGLWVPASARAASWGAADTQTNVTAMSK